MTSATDSETLSPLKIEPQSVETERPSVNITPDDGSHVPVAATPPEKQKDAESEHLKDAKSGAQSGQVPLARSESFTRQYLKDHTPNDLITEEVKGQQPPGYANDKI